MTATADDILALLERYRIARERSGDAELFPQGMTSQAIADQIGASQSTVSRRMGELVERGLAEKIGAAGGWSAR